MKNKKTKKTATNAVHKITHNVEKIKKINSHKKKHKTLKKGFYKNKKTGHPSFVYWHKDMLVHSIGFTHNKHDFADKIKLNHNINPNDNSECFALTKIQEQKDSDYKNKKEYEDYIIHNDDKSIIKQIIESKKRK